MSLAIADIVNLRENVNLLITIRLIFFPVLNAAYLDFTLRSRRFDVYFVVVLYKDLYAFI